MTKNLVRVIAVVGVVAASPALAQDVNLHKDRDVIRGVVTAGRCPVVSQ